MQNNLIQTALTQLIMMAIYTILTMQIGHILMKYHIKILSEIAEAN